MQPLLTFVQLSDSHLGPTRDYSYYGHRPYQTLARAIDLINAMPQPPDFVMHTGDLSNDRSAESYELAAELLGRLRVPLY
ncbi:MAG: metallophosphoesterase, partial [Aggregatilineaceae bacterium]